MNVQQTLNKIKQSAEYVELYDFHNDALLGSGLIIKIDEAKMYQIESQSFNVNEVVLIKTRLGEKENLTPHCSWQVVVNMSKITFREEVEAFNKMLTNS